MYMFLDLWLKDMCQTIKSYFNGLGLVKCSFVTFVSTCASVHNKHSLAR